MPTGYVYGDIYLEHDTGRGFPERPDRLRAVNRGLKEAGLLEKLTKIDPIPASTEWIAAVHTKEYIARVKKACAEAGEEVVQLDTPDMPVCARSYDVALAAVGGILAAVDQVMGGKIRNAYCAVRPPGHHALPGRAMGFCIFNNVAIAARYVQKKHKLERVLIVDWDVHHGNATQDMFYEDPSILYYSTHLHPFYPMTGGAEHRGKGEGEGTNINVPLKPGDGDIVLKKSFTEVLKPAALKFKPDFVFISCGFDSHENDQLGRLAITSQGFAELTRIVMEIAETTAKGRLVSMLEGGYTLDNLASASAAHVKVLME